MMLCDATCHNGNKEHENQLRDNDKSFQLWKTPSLLQELHPIGTNLVSKLRIEN